MNSTDIFNHIRPALGVTDPQVKALYRMIDSGASINDIAEFVGMSSQPNKETLPKDNSGFKLGARSKERLVGVHPDLVKVVNRAIEITGMDFTVGEGVRTIEKQREYVRAGKSQTMDSKHIKGLAVDLWALPDSKTVSWENQHYYVIADAMLAAAKETGVTITWGAAWGRYLNNYGSAKAAQEAYLSDRKKVGKKPFIDAVHFELP